MSNKSKSVESPDAVSRRKLQNREAQRRYRENIKQKLKQAETRMISSSSSNRSTITSSPLSDLVADMFEDGENEEGFSVDLIEFGSICSPTCVDTGSSLNARISLDSSSLSAAEFSSFLETTPPSDFNLIGLSESSPSSTTVVHLAAQKGHHEIIRILSDFGVDLTAEDNSGQTPLHLAAAHGHPDTVLALIEAGVDIDIKNNLSKTALFVAASLGQEATFRALLHSGADINIST